jgi:hypothetical protein
MRAAGPVGIGHLHEALGWELGSDRPGKSTKRLALAKTVLWQAEPVLPSPIRMVTLGNEPYIVVLRP